MTHRDRDDDRRDHGGDSLDTPDRGGDGAEVVVLADGREIGQVTVGDPNARVADATIRSRVSAVQLAVEGGYTTVGSGLGDGGDDSE